MLNNRNIQILFLLILATLIFFDFRSGIPFYLYLVLVVVYLSVTVYGSSVIQANYFLHSVCKGDTRAKAIAITFDDGPSSGHTENVLNILKTHNAPAAFFVIGKNIAGNEALVKRMDSEGHIIGNHSYSHNYWFSMTSANNMLRDLKACDGEIKRVINKQTQLFRPPYGVTNPMVAKSVKNGSYISVGWSLRTFDTTAKDPGKLLQKALTNLHNGDVVLFHDWAPYTAQMLGDFITAARAAGFAIIRVDDLLRIKPYI